MIGVLLLASCEPAANIQIQGSLQNSEAAFVYLQRFDDRSFRTIDSAKVENGRFGFEASLDLPEIYGLTTDTAKTSLLLFLEEGEIKVELNPEENYSNSVVSGSRLHAAYEAYLQNRPEDIGTYIRENPNSLVALYALYRHYAYRLSADEIQSNMALLNPDLLNTAYAATLKKLVATLESVQIGKMAPDFSAQSPDGHAISLSEKLNKSYILLDFWASWCGPCRRQKPFHKAAYERFHAEGFDIFSVSLDRDRAAWLSAIENDQLEWTHVSDLKHWNSAPAALYGVRAIPTNFLIDAEGRIVAHTLLGDDLLNKLEELYKQ